MELELQHLRPWHAVVAAVGLLALICLVWMTALNPTRADRRAERRHDRTTPPTARRSTVTEDPGPSRPNLHPDVQAALVQRFASLAATDVRLAHWWPRVERADLSWLVDGGAPPPAYRALFDSTTAYGYAAGHLAAAAWQLGQPDDVVVWALDRLTRFRELLVAGGRPRTGPAADETRPLYDQVDVATLRTLVDRFYSSLCADAATAPFFHRVDLPRLKRHQALMLSQALGGPVAFGDDRLAAAHAFTGTHQGRRLVIDDEMFGRVVGHLLAVCWDMGVPDHIVAAIVVALAGKRELIVGASRAERSTVAGQA